MKSIKRAYEKYYITSLIVIKKIINQPDNLMVRKMKDWKQQFYEHVKYGFKSFQLKTYRLNY